MFGECQSARAGDHWGKNNISKGVLRFCQQVGERLPYICKMSLIISKDDFILVV